MPKNFCSSFFFVKIFPRQVPKSYCQHRHINTNTSLELIQSTPAHFGVLLLLLSNYDRNPSDKNNTDVNKHSEAKPAKIKIYYNVKVTDEIITKFDK